MNGSCGGGESGKAQQSTECLSYLNVYSNAYIFRLLTERGAMMSYMDHFIVSLVLEVNKQLK